MLIVMWVRGSAGEPVMARQSSIFLGFSMNGKERLVFLLIHPNEQHLTSPVTVVCNSSISKTCQLWSTDHNLWLTFHFNLVNNNKQSKHGRKAINHTQYPLDATGKGIHLWLICTWKEHFTLSNQTDTVQTTDNNTTMYIPSSMSLSTWWNTFGKADNCFRSFNNCAR